MKLYKNFTKYYTRSKSTTIIMKNWYLNVAMTFNKIIWQAYLNEPFIITSRRAQKITTDQRV